jgi:hypothetical protein
VEAGSTILYLYTQGNIYFIPVNTTLYLASRLCNVDVRMINECGAVGGIRIGRGNQSTCTKPAPVPLYKTQISRDLTRDRSRALKAGGLYRVFNDTFN